MWPLTYRPFGTRQHPQHPPPTLHHGATVPPNKICFHIYESNLLCTEFRAEFRGGPLLLQFSDGVKKSAAPDFDEQRSILHSPSYQNPRGGGYPTSSAYSPKTPTFFSLFCFIFLYWAEFLAQIGHTNLNQVTRKRFRGVFKK